MICKTSAAPRLFSLFCTLSCALLAACAHPPPPRGDAPATRPATAAQTQTRPQVLLISIDGLRADALDQGLAPHLSRLAGQGVRARWMTPAYPALTFPNHYTLVTGLRPDRHGIVHNTMEDPALGRFKVGEQNAVSDARWWGGEPIWVGAERAGLRSAVWAWPGVAAPIGGLRPRHWHLFDEGVDARARALQVAGWLAERRAPVALAALYFEQVDKAGHDYGPQSPQYAQAIAEVDGAIGLLLDALREAGTLAQTDIVVVSDHGMARVPPQQVIAVEDMVPRALARVVSIGQSVGIAPLPGQTAEVEARLLGAHPQYDCWRKQELPARWHYGRHPRVPPIVCQMHEGWDALPADELAKRRAGHGRGSHGYDPALPSMRAVFLAEGPSFARGLVLPPIENVSVYPLLAQLLGIPAAPHDGDAQALQPALRADAPANIH